VPPRIAYICSAKGCDPPYRTFVGPDAAKPACPQHGAQHMALQANQPYMKGEGTGQPKRVKPRRPASGGKQKRS
jgi:hypothetical protein